MQIKFKVSNKAERENSKVESSESTIVESELASYQLIPTAEVIDCVVGKKASSMRLNAIVRSRSTGFSQLIVSRLFSSSNCVPISELMIFVFCQ